MLSARFYPLTDPSFDTCYGWDEGPIDRTAAIGAIPSPVDEQAVSLHMTPGSDVAPASSHLMHIYGRGMPVAPEREFAEGGTTVTELQQWVNIRLLTSLSIVVYS